MEIETELNHKKEEHSQASSALMLSPRYVKILATAVWLKLDGSICQEHFCTDSLVKSGKLHQLHLPKRDRNVYLYLNDINDKPHFVSTK